MYNSFVIIEGIKDYLWTKKDIFLQKIQLPDKQVYYDYKSNREKYKPLFLKDTPEFEY